MVTPPTGGRPCSGCSHPPRRARARRHRRWPRRGGPIAGAFTPAGTAPRIRAAASLRRLPTAVHDRSRSSDERSAACFSTADRRLDADRRARWRVDAGRRLRDDGAWVALQRADSRGRWCSARRVRGRSRLELHRPLPRRRALARPADFLFAPAGLRRRRYAVRGYDLAAGQLLPGSLGRKREPDEEMQGITVGTRAQRERRLGATRSTSKPNGTGFVHALDTARADGRSASTAAADERCSASPPCARRSRQTGARFVLTKPLGTGSPSSTRRLQGDGFAKP